MPGFLPSACSKYGFAFESEKIGSNNTKKKCDQGQEGEINERHKLKSNDRSKKTNPTLSLPFRGLQSIYDRMS